MANPSVTYTFSNGTTADATQVNQNFTDLINGMTDGTKSFSIDALTCAGTATFNGAVTLGNGSPDDITVTGSLASSIPIKTNNSFDIGSSTLGLAGIYLGAPSSRSTRITANQSLSASHTLVLPNGGGTSGYNMRTDGSGNLSFQAPSNSAVSNYGITATVSSNQLTVSLVGANGSAISSTNPVDLVHRHATATTGTPTILTLTSAPTACVVPDTATLGHASGANQYVHVYLIMGSANEIAVSGQRVFDEGVLQSATAISTSADDGVTLYATSGHTSKPVRYLGRIKSNQAAAGTWASSPTEICLLAGIDSKMPRSEVLLDTDAGAGSVNTKVRNFTNITTIGSALTGAVSATNGASITVNEDGVYVISSNCGRYGVSDTLEITKNSTAFISMPSNSVLAYYDSLATGTHEPTATACAVLRAGDVIRIVTFSASITANGASAHFVRMTKVSD